MKDLINILIVEDERIIAIDIANTLRRLGYAVAGEASRGEEALEIIAKKKPDLALMDILLKGEMDGIECAGIINERYKIPVIYLTAHQDNATIEKTKATNPYGFISKPLETAVRSLGAGLRHIDAAAARLLADSIVQEALTPREEAVLRRVVEGLGNKAVARDLGIGVGTVKSHLRSIYGKLGATSRTEAVTVAERRGLLDTPGQASPAVHRVARALLPPDPATLRWSARAPAVGERAEATS